MCDFWARVKIRKKSVATLASMCIESLQPRPEGGGLSFELAIEEFWKSIGIKNMPRLCKEEPDLCEKIAQVEEQVRKREAADS